MTGCCLELDRHKAKVQLVWEIQHGEAAACADGNDEFFAFGNDCEVVGKVDFGFRAESDDVADFHAGGDFRGHLIDIGSCGGERACGLLGGVHRLLGGDDREELRIWGNYLDRTGNPVFIPI